MASNNAESYNQSRMPQRPAEAMAAKGKGDKSKTPPMPSYSGCHVPMRGESATATKSTGHPDGLGEMAKRSLESRMPMTAESFVKRKGS